MHPGAFVLGYHGCDQKVGENILAGKSHVEISRNRHDWLGEGAYFWENDPHRALEWAALVKKHPQHFRHRIRTSFAIGAVIDPGHCLDLTETGALNLLKEAYDDMVKTFQKMEVALPENEKGFDDDLDLVKRNLDCAAINYLHQLRAERGLPEFDSVRAAFWEGKPLFPGARIMERTHVQVCVRKPHASIRGYFRLPSLPE